MARLRRLAALNRPLSALLLLAVLYFSACSNRPAIAAKATVQTFYAAIQDDNAPVVADNVAQSASAAFREHVRMAAVAAQAGGAAQQAVEIVRVDAPAISDNTARVHVVFADGGSDTVSLEREGARWKVVSSGRLR